MEGTRVGGCESEKNIEAGRGRVGVTEREAGDPAHVSIRN